MHSIEGFNSIPEGYEKGRTKYIIITGSVISGVGKGIIASSISRLIESSGLKAFPFKFDGYLNLNAGTLSPYRHGEVFVLDDGMECDMDLGTYERFINSNLTSKNYLTAGQLFKQILNNEKKGVYLGRDVQFIPHVTGEIKKLIRERGSNSDFMIIEVGGTVGDIENNYFLEAMRELIVEEGRENVLLINVTYVLEPRSLGEQKSKPAQNGLKELMRCGLKPDVIIVRSERLISDSINHKLSVASATPINHILNLPDASTIYEVPIQLLKQELPLLINKQLSVNIKPELSEWIDFVKNVKNPEKEVKIMIAGKYTKVSDSYASIIESLIHAGAINNIKVTYELIETTNINYETAKKILNNFKGLIVPGGFGTRGVEGKINFIRAARELKKPFLGLCYGMQLAVIEFARNVCGLTKAHTTEINPSTTEPVVYLLPEQERIKELSGTMRLGGHETILKENTKAARLYNSLKIRERFRHRYEVNPEYVSLLESKGLIFSGESEKGLVKQLIELENHPFFMASQFHPELTSKPLKPNPLFKGFIKAVITN